MTDQHPITPPPELVEKWYDSIHGDSTSWKQELATKAARWGADQELDACCEWLPQFRLQGDVLSARLRAARRPKAKSQAEEALEAQRRMRGGTSTHDDWELVRSALERLQELEGQGDG